eukprot:2405736-Amphidinium_carterae.1
MCCVQGAAKRERRPPRCTRHAELDSVTESATCPADQFEGIAVFQVKRRHALCNRPHCGCQPFACSTVVRRSNRRVTSFDTADKTADGANARK